LNWQLLSPINHEFHHGLSGLSYHPEWHSHTHRGHRLTPAPKPSSVSSSCSPAPLHSQSLIRALYFHSVKVLWFCNKNLPFLKPVIRLNPHRKTKIQTVMMQIYNMYCVFSLDLKPQNIKHLFSILMVMRSVSWASNKSIRRFLKDHVTVLKALPCRNKLLFKIELYI